MSRPPEDCLPEDRAPDPMAVLDADRFDTRALDLGAVRAIQAACAGSAEQAASGVGGRSAGVTAAGAEVSGAEVSGAEVSGAEMSGAEVSGAEVSGAEVSGADARFATIEIDYSPATRRTRERSAKVQRAARAVMAACLVVALVIGAWALVRTGWRAAPLPAGQPLTSARQAAPLPGETAQIMAPPPHGTGAGAAAATSTGVSSSTSSGTGRSTISTPPVPPLKSPYAVPAPSLWSSGASGVSGASAVPSKGPTAGPPASTTATLTAAVPPAASPPAGTVSIPILE